MNIEEYLGIIKIKELNTVNPAVEDIYNEFKKDKSLDAVKYKVIYEINQNDEYPVIQNNSHDIIYNIKCNSNVSLKVNDVLKPLESYIFQDENVNTKLCINKDCKDNIIIEFTGYFVSNIVKHEFRYYLKNNLLNN